MEFFTFITLIVALLVILFYAVALFAKPLLVKLLAFGFFVLAQFFVSHYGVDVDPSYEGGVVVGLIVLGFLALFDLHTFIGLTAIVVSLIFVYANGVDKGLGFLATFANAPLLLFYACSFDNRTTTYDHEGKDRGGMVYESGKGNSPGTFSPPPQTGTTKYSFNQVFKLGRVCESVSHNRVIPTDSSGWINIFNKDIEADKEYVGLKFHSNVEVIEHPYTRNQDAYTEYKEHPCHYELILAKQAYHTLGYFAGGYGKVMELSINKGYKVRLHGFSKKDLLILDDNEGIIEVV